MTVRQLKELNFAYSDYLASLHGDMMNRQELGFGMKYYSHSIAIDTILFNNLVKANELFLDSDAVSVPDWFPTNSFIQFISKINHYASNLIP